MVNEHFPETDPGEIQHSKHVMLLLQRVDKLTTAIKEDIDVEPGSKLAADDERTPHYPVSQYAYTQIIVALGCLESLRHMIVRREDEETVDMVVGPFGPYAVVRNSLDCAAMALWLLQPVNPKLRIKRRIMIEVDEIKKGAAIRESVGSKGWKGWRKSGLNRMKEVADLAGVGEWNPLNDKAKLPSMTDTLKKLECHHGDVVMPWLSAWQMASGHAHGKAWAQIASHQVDEITDTRTEYGATFRVSIKYGMLAVLLYEAVQLIETAGTRYRQLARPAR